MEFRLSFDDGSALDLQIADLIEKYKLQKYTTFYIPTNCELINPEIKQLSKRGFGIGGHTTSHPQDLKLLPKEIQEQEIDSNKKWLEEVLGKRITSFAYPRGRYNEITIELVRKALYEEARTTIVLETSYENKFRKHTTIHIYPRREYQGEKWEKLAREYFLKAKGDNSYFHLWGHSWEIEKLKQWQKVGFFLRWLSEGL